MPYTLLFKHHFDSAHQLPGLEGPCSRLHGHRWQVEVRIEADELVDGMVVDFNQLEKIIDRLDHSYLNDKLEVVPTAENLARFLKEEIDRETGRKSEITVWETPEASITYR